MAQRQTGEYTADYNEYGGYDCMTSAFFIYRNLRIVAVVDLNHFGQKACEDDTEARAAAQIVVDEMLSKLNYEFGDRLGGEE